MTCVIFGLFFFCLCQCLPIHPKEGILRQWDKLDKCPCVDHQENWETPGSDSLSIMTRVAWGSKAKRDWIKVHRAVNGTVSDDG